MPRCLFALCLFVLPLFGADSTPPAGVKVEWVVRVPISTPPAGPIHVAGNFNGWNPGDPAWRLARRSDGRWTGTFSVPQGGALEYKLTRGSWESVEKAADGTELPNRQVEPTAGLCVNLEVAAWRDQVKAPELRHTVVGDLRIVPAPGLPGRSLRILLPPGYEKGSARYPVLYLADGQNLFDAATGFAGEWEVDESLDRLWRSGQVAPLIVVGIDHAGEGRLAEYSPFVDARIPEPRGERFGNWLVETLKPWVDQQYRTEPGATHTALGGSSLGGLMAVATALRHPGSFGRVLCFSGSFWVGEGAMIRALRGMSVDPRLRLYLDVGTLEGSSLEGRQQMVQDTQELAAALRAKGLSERQLKVEVVEGARHNEAAWAARLPKALLWLFPR